MTRLRWVFLCAFLSAGCGPTLDVRPNPGPFDGGLRYYLPKPYLLVEPATAEATGKDAADKVARPRGDLFKISLQYLPDFSEEYALSVRTGLGTCKTKLTLEHGWNLTSVDVDCDSKTSDNISAITNLLKAAAPDGVIAGPKSKGSDESTPRGGAPSTPGGATHEFFVAASNVPVGYYESVIGTDSCTGKKQLYGFRYVGFIPFGSCPINPVGSAAASCTDGSMQLYGLVFERGAMTFKPIAYEIQANTSRVPVQVNQTEVREEKTPPTVTTIQTSKPAAQGSASGPVQAGLPANSRPSEKTSKGATVQKDPINLLVR
jgi:hypothetical protein